MTEERELKLAQFVGGWDGFDVVGVHREGTPEPDALGLPATRLVLRLEAISGFPKQCSGCGAIVTEVHDVSERRVRDLPILEPLLAAVAPPRAGEPKLTPLIAFARMLAVHLEGILSHCRYPLHTSLLEGINNKIKVLKRMAYGFRDDAYFFLKIRAAFPGIPQ